MIDYKNGRAFIPSGFSLDAQSIEILEKLVSQGYFKTKSAAIRGALLEFDKNLDGYLGTYPEVRPRHGLHRLKKGSQSYRMLEALVSHPEGLMQYQIAEHLNIKSNRVSGSLETLKVNNLIYTSGGKFHAIEGLVL